MIPSTLSPLLLRAGLRYQLRHRWQLLLALIGVATGVTVVLAVDLANSAAKASFELSSRQLSGAATHRIVGGTGDMPETVYSTLFTSPGHPPIAPVVNARIRVGDAEEKLELIGLDLFAERDFRNQLPGLIQGTPSVTDWLTQPDGIALSASAARHLGVELGDRVALYHQGRRFDARVHAVGSDDSVASSRIIIADIATAQAITATRGRLSHIDVILSPGQQRWLESRLPSNVRLVSIAELNRDTVGLSASFELNLTAMSLLALMVGLFLIFNAISFSIVQRRSLLGRLRALGVTQAEISRLILHEALVLGVLGTLLGTLLGMWLGDGLTRIVAATVSELYYQVSADAMSVSWTALLKAWSIGIAGTMVAAWLPARQAGKTPPLTTLSRAELEHRTRQRLPILGALGAGLLVGGLLIAQFFPGGLMAGFTGLFVMLLGAALITPSMLRVSHWVLSRMPVTGVWRIAFRDLDRHLSRLSTAAAALMVALAASVGVAVMVESMRGSVSDWLRDLLRADLYVAASGFEDGAHLPPAAVAQILAVPRVGDYSTYRSRMLQADGRRIKLIAATLAPPSRQGFDLIETTDAKTWDRFEQGQLLISEPLANRLALSPGDRLILPTDDGPHPYTVAAVFRDFASEHGRAFIEHAHYRQRWRDSKTDTLALFTADGDPKTLFEDIAAELGGQHDLEFTAAGEIYDLSMAVFDRTFRITEVLRLLSVLVAFIGVLSALMALQLERQREFAILRALGLTRMQVSQVIVIESLTLGLLAALLALPTGLAMAWVLTSAIQLRAFGWSMPFLPSAEPLLATLLVGLVAAFLASLYPAWRSAHRDPAYQLREE